MDEIMVVVPEIIWDVGVAPEVVVHEVDVTRVTEDDTIVLVATIEVENGEAIMVNYDSIKSKSSLHIFPITFLHFTDR